MPPPPPPPTPPEAAEEAPPAPPEPPVDESVAAAAPTPPGAAQEASPSDSPQEPPAEEPVALATPAASGGEAPAVVEGQPEPEAPPEPPTEEPVALATPAASGGEAPPVVGGQPPPDAPAPKPRPKRPPRPREPLPWPELRAVAAMAREGADVEELKELFRTLPNEVRDETVEGVREYRKGARRPVSAHAGKSLARAVHTARRARRRPDSDEAVSEAIGQALAAEVIASLDVEVAAEVILPKRDLLDRESRNARRRQKAEDDKARDEKRRRAREENSQSGAKDGSYSGAKIRGLDELSKLFPGDDSKYALARAGCPAVGLREERWRGPVIPPSSRTAPCGTLEGRDADPRFSGVTAGP